MNANDPLNTSEQISKHMENGDYRKAFIHIFASQIVLGYEDKKKVSSDFDYLSRKIKIVTALHFIVTLALAFFAFLAFESSTFVGIVLSLATTYCGFRTAISFAGQYLFSIFKAIKTKDDKALTATNKDDVEIVQYYVDKVKGMNTTQATHAAETA